MKPTERILFVDDDPLARRAFARAMRQRGFIVDVAADGREALELAESYPYAVVAADWHMPNLDGLTLANQLSQQVNEPVFLLVTGASPSDVGTNAKHLRSIRTVIYKPWDPEDLSCVIGEAFDCHRAGQPILARPSTAPPQSLHALRLPILVVGEDPHDVEMISRMLAQAASGCYEVEHVDTLDEAELALSERHYYALIADLTPCDSGQLDELGRIRVLADHAPVVAISNSTDEEVALRAVHAGAQDYLLKDEITGKTLHRAIRYAIERKRAEERLTHLAQHDQLTQLANRSLLRERLGHALTRAKRRKTHVGVFFLDLDRFKLVNDSMGHDAGDALLRDVASRLKSAVRDCDTVARLGGDEFAIVLEELNDAEQATLLAGRVLNSFATPFDVSGQSLVTTTSIGIALYPHNGETTEQLLKCADSAMYRAKETGRNNYQFFSAELHEKAVQQVETEALLRKALDEEQFVLHFQPQVDTRTGKLIGAEALVRWQLEDRLVPPGDFIPVLESSTLMVEVGQWILQTACETAKDWYDAGFPDFRIAVNISARQFDDPLFVETVRRAISDSGLSPHNVELEITESVIMHDTKRTQETLRELKQLGVRIAMDDFGTGYSSLAYLKRFPIDTLKIDRSFVRDVITDESDAALTSAVIALGQRLGIEVVAEGVETDEQLRFLAHEGCKSIQGFFVQRPCAAKPFSAWLQALEDGCWFNTQPASVAKPLVANRNLAQAG